MKKAGKILMYMGVIVLVLFVVLTIFVSSTTPAGFNSSDMGMFLGIFGVGITLPIVAVLLIIGGLLLSWGNFKKR